MRFFITILLLACSLQAADWPMWRSDSGRTASTAMELPEDLKVLWMRDLPPLTPCYRDVRLQFDRSYEPVVAGKKLVVGSSRDDCVMAFHTETGAEVWRVHADGPVRFAPVIADGRVIFGSDDGVVRCVALETGAPIWQKRAVPNRRHVLGNGRMISVWPVRGGPVIKDGRVYFAAGVWPLEGIFIYCLDAATGKEIWLNDRTGYIYGIHPHGAEAFGGVAPQGYLLTDGDDLVVPCSSAYPARFDLNTGALKDFALPAAGRLPGGWFAATAEAKEEQKLKRRGLLHDSSVNVKRHEDKLREEGDADVRRSIRAGGHELSFEEPWPAPVKGNIHSVIAADGKCFITTEDGQLFALAAGDRVTAEPKHWTRNTSLKTAARETADAMLKLAGSDRGHALVIGSGEPGFMESLVAGSQFKFFALLPEGADAAAAQDRLIAAGLYGERVALQKATPAAAGLPPYFASLAIIAPGSPSPDAAELKAIYAALRPYGGTLIGPTKLATLADAAQLEGAKIKRHAGDLVTVTREGALRGGTNYEGDWVASEDALVRAPVGALWFDDTLANFKRAPQPKIVDGVMVTADKDWLDASTRKGPVDYRLKPAVFSDVYTGRVLDEYEAPTQRKRFSKIDLVTIQQNQYRPPQQKSDYKPEAPKAGTRVNPLTLEEEPRVFPKSYGCDGGFDYGSIYTMRSGTAAFYDKRSESGTIHISGPRSGCTNSIVPANGVLNVPYFFEGCTCSYPLPMAVSLVSLPPTFEQWMAWGAVPAEETEGKIQRIGINFGAPGDRKTDDGTLWLGQPSTGGPSPELGLQTEPAKPATFYHHSVWIEGGEGWPWVAASGSEGLRGVTLSGLMDGTYTVRLTFTEPDRTMKIGARVFDVAIQDKPALHDLDVLAESGGAMRALTKTIPDVVISGGTLTLRLKAKHGQSVLCGIEIIRAGLPLKAPPSPARVPGRM